MVFLLMGLWPDGCLSPARGAVVLGTRAEQRHSLKSPLIAPHHCFAILQPRRLHYGKPVHVHDITAKPLPLLHLTAMELDDADCKSIAGLECSTPASKKLC